MSKLVIGVVLLLGLSACSKAPQDKFIGSWNYSGSGKLMTVPLKCAIDLTIVKNDKSYTLSTLSLNLNPSVFGLNGGEFFRDAALTIKDDNTLITPKLPNGSPITITYLKDSNQVSLNPNPCNGITSGGLLNKK
jgi:hypothetical protein